jgi:ADP-heptose:LPS heptosyltransferase
VVFSLKILLIQLRQLGDIMLTTPAIRALHQAYPRAQIDFLSHPMGKLVLNGNQNLKNHIVYDPKSIADQIKLMGQLRLSHYDIVIDFMSNPRSALFSLSTGAKRRISFKSPRFWAYNELVTRVSGDIYIVREKLQLLKSLGIDSNDVRLDLSWEEKDFQAIESSINGVRQTDSSTQSPLVILSPTHRREERRWVPESWRSLAHRLVKEMNARVLWLWGPGERGFVVEVSGCGSGPIDARGGIVSSTLGGQWLCPETNFRQMAALMAQCDLFIGTSNGPSHVAVAVNTPSLQLHGPTDGLSWCPNSTRHRFIQKTQMPEISVEEVLSLCTDPSFSQQWRAAGQRKITSSADVRIHRPEL